MRNSIKVSVIIPVYNVEMYLKKCIDSVLAQTLWEIEIICVDDGSTDSCPEILDNYAAMDARIHVIHQANSGYGRAVNVGFLNAAGEYLGIVESDDYIMPQMYETLYKTASEQDLDVVKSDYCKFWGQYVFRDHKKRLDPYYDRVLSEEERKWFFEFDMFNWTGIYKRSFIERNKICHTETPGASYQDTGFWLKVMALCRRIEWVSEAFYMYRQDNMNCSSKSKEKMLNHKIEYDLFEKEEIYPAVRDIVDLYRIDIYRFDFYRIDQSLRREYAGIILQDYAKVKDHLNATDMERLKDVLDWYEKLVQDPDGFCDEVSDKERSFLDLINRYDKLVMYGTGSRGMETYTKLKKIGKSEKIMYAVNTKPSEEMFFDKEVKRPNSLSKRKDTLVLICVTRGNKAFAEIEAVLQKLGITDYCDTEGIRSIE